MSGGRVAGMYKPFAPPWHRLWPALWWLAVIAVVVLSLVPTPQMDLPRDSDKVQHVLAYAVLAAAAVQVFRSGRALLVAAIGLVSMGVLLEFVQGAATTYRMADPADALANALGVALGLSTALSPWRDALLRWSGGRG